MKFKTTFFKRGFTLIEILVVIAIIGALVAVLYANFDEARKSTKDQAFQVELKEMKLAIELYKAQNGVYPPAKDTGAGNFFCSGVIAVSSVTGCDPIIEEISPDYIDELPDPSASANSDCAIAYIRRDGGNSFKLIGINCHQAVTAAADGVQPSDDFARCPSSCSTGNCSGVPYNSYTSQPAFYQSFAVYSEGGACF